MLQNTGAVLSIAFVIAIVTSGVPKEVLFKIFSGPRLRSADLRARHLHPEHAHRPLGPGGHLADRRRRLAAAAAPRHAPGRLTPCRPRIGSRHERGAPSGSGTWRSSRGTTPRTIRYYEEIGLLPPGRSASPARTAPTARTTSSACGSCSGFASCSASRSRSSRELAAAETARASLRREWHEGIEDPVRQREVLEQSLGAHREPARARSPPPRRDRGAPAASWRRSGAGSATAPRSAASAAAALRQADLSVDHRDHAAGDPRAAVGHLDLEHARPTHLLALANQEALDPDALVEIRAERPGGRARRRVLPHLGGAGEGAGPDGLAVRVEPGQVDDDRAVRLRELVDRRVVGQRAGEGLVIGDRRHHVGHPGRDDLGRQLGVGVLGAQADGRHHRVAIELRPELRLVLEHRRPPAPVRTCGPRSAGARRRSPGRSSPRPARASAPPRPRSRATG